MNYVATVNIIVVPKHGTETIVIYKDGKDSRKSKKYKEAIEDLVLNSFVRANYLLILQCRITYPAWRMQQL